MRSLALKISLLFLVCIPMRMVAGEKTDHGLPRIEQLISHDSLDSAESEIKQQIHTLLLAEAYDSLAHYVGLLGKLEKYLNRDPLASLKLAQQIEDNSTDPCTLCLLYRNLASVYFHIAQVENAYAYALRAKALAAECKSKVTAVEIEYDLGDYSLKMGNVTQFKQHIRHALKLIQSAPSIHFKIAARVYNYMGAVMYFMSEQDSALYYFQKGLDEIPKMENNAENRLYLPSSIKGNMFLIKLNQGNHKEARQLVEETILLNRRFLNETKNHPLKSRVLRNTSIAYTNLTSLYFSFGDYRNADRITQISYHFTKKHFPPRTEEYFIATLPVAEVKVALLDFNEALYYLDEAQACLDKMDGENWQWHAYLNNVYGTVYYKLKEFDQAITYLERSDAFYSKSNGNEYSTNRLQNAMNLSIAYAHVKKKEKAMLTVQKAYEYMLENEGEKDHLTNALMVTLSRVAIILEEYAQSLEWSNKSLQLFKKYQQLGDFDKLLFEEHKAAVLLLNAKATYALEELKDSTFLVGLLKQMQEAIHILEEQRAYISDEESANRLLEDNKELFEFAKQLSLELYHITQNKTYLYALINFHESALYNRIRARLNINKSLLFKDVPPEIIQRENHLRGLLRSARYEESDTLAIQTLMSNQQQWSFFLDSLKTNFPRYYKMRYASIGQALNNLKNKVPKETCVIRYFFIDSLLYAFVLNQSNEELLALDYAPVQNHIKAINAQQNELETCSTLLYELYQQVWAPLANKMHTKKIIVIPDGELYNLSFEMLTPTKIQSFDELAVQSLLSQHALSYNYSLLLLNGSEEKTTFQHNFIAFAPGFTDNMKQAYKLSITDSSEIDKAYLRLLPQPFSADLASRYSHIFEGTSFINEQSTVNVFRNRANEHKIIHIGTHAESNNISPELSRLIFAKNTQRDTIEDNSLYTYEIFNMRLNSNLAILTACETGKPGYQQGEGMISLAHAFNYAGSESLVTSLWNIDEKSSTTIISSFYHYLVEGLSKDEALRQAKLDYIRSAHNRTISPNYWAGLILMGDASPIEISKSKNWVYLIVAFSLILGLLLMVFRKQGPS